MAKIVTRIKTQHSGRLIRFIINSILSFTMVLCVVLLILFIRDHERKSMLSGDFYLPEINTFLVSITTITLRRSTSPHSGILHSMSDDELFRKAMVSPQRESTFSKSPKIAFMFLVRGKLPLGPIWEKFFNGHDNLYSIYLHCSDGCSDSISNTSVFYKRTIPSKVVEWGKASMIDAERRILGNALLDSCNERFVLLSETCIPFYNFTTTYNYLINSNQSFLSSFDDPRKIGRGRYNKRMWPAITITDWRKGSQWFEVNRRLAVEIISDKKYYPIFCDHCKPPCYMDEHYLATLVNILHPELNSNRTITWVDWSAGGSHPKTFRRNDISEEFLDHIREGPNCTYNGSFSSICFLFARKLHPSTLEPLLKITATLYG